MNVHVLYEGEPGVLAADHGVTIEGVRLQHLLDAAIRAAPAADRIELCGGIDVADVARVVATVGDVVQVRANRYGFESLEQVAAYKRAFGEDTAGDAAFFYGAAVSTPLAAHPGVLVAAAADDAALADLAREAQARGAGIVELYAGLGAHGAAVVRSATGDAVPVGYID